MNLQKVKENHADQPAKKRATTYRTHVLPQVNRCAWKQLISNKTG